jgi:hypothetical protein
VVSQHAISGILSLHLIFPTTSARPPPTSSLFLPFFLSMKENANAPPRCGTTPPLSQPSWQRPSRPSGAGIWAVVRDEVGVEGQGQGGWALTLYRRALGVGSLLLSMSVLKAPMSLPSLDPRHTLPCGPHGNIPFGAGPVAMRVVALSQRRVGGDRRQPFSIGSRIPTRGG